MESSTRYKIAQFIRNNIAPGGRAFISYEIEQAIRNAFGDYLVNVKGERYPLHFLWEEISDAHAAVLERMGEVSRSIFEHYQRQEPVDYDSELASIYYSLYYLPRNLHKVQFILLDLFERGMLPESIRALDIGSAVGTVPLAVADFYNLLRNTCALFDVEEISQPTVTSFSCLDASAVNLENLHRIWSNLVVSSNDFPEPETHVVKIGLGEHWQEQIPSGSYNLIFASNFLNELSDFGIFQRADLVEEFAGHLSEDGLIVLIEPADETNAKNLHGLQWELVQRGLHVQLPCLGSHTADDAGGCRNCWSWRSESLRMPSISRSLIWHNNKQDEEAIKWCFSVLGHSPKVPFSNSLSKLDKLTLGEINVKVQAVSPIIGQQWVKICGSDGNSGHAILELDEHQVLTAFTPGDSLNLQRVEVSPPVRSGPIAGMKRIRFTARSQSLLDGNQHDAPGMVSQRVYRPEEKEAILRYFLRRLFGFASFRPGQFEIITRILAGQDTFGIMATSAGKSLCFQFPAMLLPGIALVVAPLKSLVQDQVYNLRRMGFENVVRIDSDAESVETSLIRIMEGYYKLVYITPEQLTNERVVAKLREAGRRHGISLFAVDEVHCLSQWGHDFRPAYLNLFRHFREIDPLSDGNNRTPIVGLTATASEYVIEDVLSSLHFHQSALIRHSFDRPELSFEVVSIEQDEDRLEKLVNLIDTHLPTVIKQPIWPGIIFVPYKGDDLDPGSEKYLFSSEGLAKELKSRGYTTAFHHSSMSTTDREQVQEDFKNGNIDILVATKGFGMGIDKENIRFIIHFSMPESPESYYQQAGRAGRGGEHSHCILMYQAPSTKQGEKSEQQTDYNRQVYFIEEKYPGTMEDIQQVWAYLSNYAESSRSNSDTNIVYINPDQILIELNWITTEDLTKSKDGAAEYEKWRSFEKEWNRLVQDVEKHIHSNVSHQPHIDQIRSVKPSDTPASEEDWKYLLRKVKKPGDRNQVRARLSVTLGQGEMGPRWAASVADRLRGLYKNRQSSNKLGEVNKRIFRVLNALQRMKFIVLWDTVETTASIYRLSPWSKIETEVADPYVLEFFSRIKGVYSTEKYNSLPPRKEEILSLDNLYQDLSMDVLQLHTILDYLKKRKFLKISYKDKAYILRLNPDWVSLPNEEQQKRFNTEFDLLEKRRLREYDMLNSMQRYIDTTACRRQSIVGYFLQKNQSRVIVRCNFCDNCCPNGITGERAQLEEASRWQLEVVQNVQAILEEDLSPRPEPTSQDIEHIHHVAIVMHPQENETPIWDMIAGMCESHLENRCIGSWRAPFLHMVMEFEQVSKEPGLRYFRRLKAHEQFRGRYEQLRQLALIVQGYYPDEYDVVEVLYETSSILEMPEQQQIEYLQQLILIDYDRQPDYLFRYGVYERTMGLMESRNHILDAFHRWIKMGKISSVKSGIVQLAKEDIFQEDLPNWIRLVYEQDVETSFSLLEQLVQIKSLENIVLRSIEAAFPLFSTKSHYLMRTTKLARLLGAGSLEIKCHQNLLAMAEQDPSIDQFSAHAALVNLYSEGTAWQNIQKYREHSSLAARLAGDNSVVLKLYRPLCKNWDINDLDEEIVWIEKQQRMGWEDIVFHLLDEWHNLHKNREQIINLSELFLRWKLEGRLCYPKTTLILSKAPITEVVNFPLLLPDWIKGQPNKLSNTISWFEPLIALQLELDVNIKLLLLQHLLKSLEMYGIRPDTLSSTAFQKCIQEITYSLFRLPIFSDQAHHIWWQFCLYWPKHLNQYLDFLSHLPENDEKNLMEVIRFILENGMYKASPDIIETILNIFQTIPKRFPPPFLSTALTEISGLAPVDFHQQIIEILLICLSLPKHTPLDYINTLIVCQKMHREDVELTVRETACNDEVFEGDTAFLIENYVRLARCYATGSPMANREKCFEYCLSAVQLDKDLFSEKLLLPYRGFLAQISWEMLHTDLDQINATSADSCFSPLLLTIWVKSHHSREELAQTCAYMAEKNRFMSWKADYTEDLINLIDLEVVSNYPPLIEHMIGRSEKFFAKFKSQSSWALKQSITLHRKGIRFSETQAGEIWNSIQLISTETLAEYFEQLLDDLILAKSFFKNLIPTGTVISPNACLAFFKRYSIEQLSKDFPELSIKMLRSTTGKRWISGVYGEQWPLLRINFRSLFKSLTQVPEFHQEAYAAWLDLCRVWPEECLLALKDVLVYHPEYYRLIDAYWACFIEYADVNELDAMRKDFYQIPETVITPRIKSGLLLISLFDDLGRRSDITICNPLEGKHFRDIFAVFSPKRDVEHALMVVALLEVLRRKIKPGWLTPLSFYIESLAYAGLIKDACTIANSKPELRVGTQKIPVREFLSKFEEIEPQEKIYRNDYIKIAQILTDEWAYKIS